MSVHGLERTPFSNISPFWATKTNKNFLVTTLMFVENRQLKTNTKNKAKINLTRNV
jgi:hypothetical protein